MGTEQVLLHECCVVPVRVSELGTEFCLMTPVSENRWEFPKVQLAPNAKPQAADLARAAAGAGLNGTVVGREALGSYVASRHNETRSMVAYLMQVDDALERFPKQTSHRRLWCLPEEARARIRRKPLRRLIDLALHTLETQAAEANDTNGSHTNGAIGSH